MHTSSWQLATSKSLEKRIASEKQLMKNVRNINRKERKRLNEKAKYWEGIAVKTRSEKNLEATAKNLEIEELKNKICMIEIESKTNKKNLQDEMENVQILQDLQEGIVDLTVKSQNGRYTFDTRTDVCVMDLLDCGIAYEKVSHAIKSVMHMCGLKSRNDVYPKKYYVANCNQRKLSLSHRHTAEICSENEHQTLYTDETRKQGETFASFITTDENRSPYLLGLKQMANKAAQTQLDTFKMILDDIDRRVSCLNVDQHLQSSVAFKILKNIQFTMSDRAATECVFNELLQAYREKLLKEHVENFNDLPDVEQDLLTRMYNFFCGLHLIVNIADIVNKGFLENQTDHLFDDDNSVQDKSGDSEVVRASRCICKAFAVGGDKKCGTSLEFKTYLKRKDVKFPQLKPFHGNRFNIVFHNGGIAYYLREHIQTFLEDVKSEGKLSNLNGLLKSVLKAVQSPTVITGFRALGVFNKFISTPLLKILEDKSTHILDMNKRYKTLITYLETVSVDVIRAQDLITGEFRPFEDVAIKKDQVWASLVQSDNDAECVAILSNISSAVCKALKDKVKDHLDDGRHTQYDETDRERLKSVLPHNKLPERVFGQLDWLLRHRPNSSKLANEVHIVYTLNKTGQWLHEHDEKQVMELIKWSKEQLKSVIDTENKRLHELDAQLTQISIDTENRAKQVLAKSLEKKETLTKEILKLGLCDSKQLVTKKMKRLKTKKEKQNALKSQINFRHFVLEQKAEKRLFRTNKYQKKVVTIDQLQSNLILLIEMAKQNKDLVQRLEE